MRIDKYIIYAILAAVLYAFSTPISKLLLINLSPIYIAALLYLGAGIGMGLVALIRKKLKSLQINHLQNKNYLPYY